MTDINRRSAALMAMLAPLAAAGMSSGAGATEPVAPSAPAAAPPPPQHDMSEMPASWTQSADIAMLVYPRMTALDLIGPQYMFASLMGARVHLVAKSLTPVTSDTGVTITPTKTFADCPRDLAVLFAPGGTDGTLAAMADAETRAFMADRGSRARYVTSVCTGSLILGAAGLLQGYQATSHWAARSSLTEFGAIPVEARYVKDRNRITGAGVTAGLDFGLHILAELRDETYAQSIQLMCEYDPQPPFNAGSPRTAPPAIRDFVAAMVANFPASIHSVAQAIRASA